MPYLTSSLAARALRAVSLSLFLAAAGTNAALGAPADTGLPAYAVVRDAIPQPLTATPGDAAAGKRVIENRKLGN